MKFNWVVSDNMQAVLVNEYSTQQEMIDKVVDNPGIIRTYLEGMVPSILGFAIQVLVAILVLFIGSRLIKLIIRILDKALKRGNVEAGVITFLGSLVRYSLYFVLAMIILAQFGIATSSVVAVLGSAGLTLGLALQGSLSNFAGGVLILLLKPFVVGDYIVDGGTGKEGTVSSITIFYTKLLTIDNQLVMIPNGTLSNSSITNISHMENRRIDLIIGVSYEADLSNVKAVFQEVVTREADVLHEEPVDIYVSELGDSSVNMGLRVWVKNADYWPVRWRLLENLKHALDENAIPIPYQQLDVHMQMHEQDEQNQ